MSEYRFDLSNFTIGDQFELQEAARAMDVRRTLLLANRFIPTNLLALPMSEMVTVLSCFLIAVSQAQRIDNDPIAELVRKALESEE